MANSWKTIYNYHPKFKAASEGQIKNCLNCHFNPMTEPEFVASRLTGKIDFICQYNGMFRVKDMNFYNNPNQCANYQLKRVTTQSPD